MTEVKSSLAEYYREAAKEFAHPIVPLTTEFVLQELTKQTGSRLKFVLGFMKPAMRNSPTPRDYAVNNQPHTYVLPISAFPDEIVDLSLILNNKNIQPASASELNSYMRHAGRKCHERLMMQVAHALGDDANKLLNMLCIDSDAQERWKAGGTVDLQELVNISPEANAQMAKRIFGDKPKPDTSYEKGNVVELFSFMAAVPYRYGYEQRKRSTTPEVLPIFERLLHVSQTARDKTLMLLHNYRLLPHSLLAESITLEGYQTLGAMEEMSEYDSWMNTKTSLLENESGSSHADTSREMTKSVAKGLIEFLGLDEEGARRIEETMIGMQMIDAKPQVDALSAEERALLEKSHRYLASHDPQQRRPLREAIGCDTLKNELKAAKNMEIHHVTGAKEREICSRIFAAVSLFPYAPNDTEENRARSYAFGSPAYAAQHRRLTCFTGPWLMATMAMECGIGYDQLFYCESHEDDTNRSATHGALMVMYTDGGIGFLDYGYERCNRTLGLDAIPDQTERKSLRFMIEKSANLAQSGAKISHEGVRVRIPAETADAFKLYRHMHIMPLDQGFASTMLLHVGIGMEHAGKVEEALAAYELGLVSNMESPALLSSAALLMIRAEQYDRAERLLNMALQAYDRHVQAWYGMALLEMKRGNEQQARVWIKKIAEDTRTVWGTQDFKRRCRHLNYIQKTIARLERELEGAEAVDENS